MTRKRDSTRARRVSHMLQRRKASYAPLIYSINFSPPKAGILHSQRKEWDSGEPH
jgi:hypothetical protein